MCLIEGASYYSTESECSVTALLSGTLVVLRALEREDLTNLHKWQNDEEIMRLARSFPDHVISKEALEAEFARELKGEDTGRRAPPKRCGLLRQQVPRLGCTWPAQTGIRIDKSRCRNIEQRNDR